MSHSFSNISQPNSKLYRKFFRQDLQDFKDFLFGFPDESQKNSIAFGEKKNSIKLKYVQKYTFLAVNYVKKEIQLIL